MNKVVEEALTNLIRRVEILESKLTYNQNNVNKEKDTYENVNPNTATPGQIKYIRMLGGNPDGMTKDQARDTIDRLLKDKETGIVEPKEVDTDEAGLDGDLMWKKI